MLSRRMSWLGRRQEVLGQNIANADTPDYQARDLKDSEFKAMLKARTSPVKLAATDDAHITFAGAAPLAPAGDGGASHHPSRDFRPTAVEPTHEPGATGNTVDLESEVIKVSATSAEYQLITSLYRKHVSMIRTALGRGGG